MKRSELRKALVGPALALIVGVSLSILGGYGVDVPYNETLIIVFVVFASFYSGIASGFATAAVAFGLLLLTVFLPATFPAFFGPHEIIDVGITLPFIIVIASFLRRRLDERLRGAVEDYRVVVESINEVFFVVDTDFRTLHYVSPAYEKIWRMTAAELYKDPTAWLQLVHVQDRALVSAYLDALVPGDPYNPDTVCLFRVIRNDGSMRWMSMKASVNRGEGGRKNRYIGLMYDVTKAVLVEENARVLTRRFDKLLAGTPVLIFTTDKDGILTCQNGSGGKRAGMLPDMGVGFSYLERYKSETRHIENVRRALKGETISDKLHIGEGEFSVEYGAIRSVSGEIEGMVGVATDITERSSAEESVRNLDALKNKFSTVVSHQLRTPLSAVRWNLESVLGGELGKLKAGHEQFLRMAYVANGEVITRINDLLLAMDIEEGSMVAAKRKMDIGSVCDPVMVEAVRRCDLKGLNFSYEPLKGKPVLIDIDADKIRSIFEKLANNATQYTKDGNVTAKLYSIDGFIRFEMTDTGIGIPQQEQSLIFNRFFRASNASVVRTDASGLGLFIAKHFIEQHGGKIGFTSKEGVGSTFWFEIPVK